MSLRQHVEIKSPLVWAVTDEPHRVLEIVTRYATREVLRLDALKGILRWDCDLGEWRVVLFEHTMMDGSTILEPSFEMQEAMARALANHSTLVIDNSHLSAERLVAFYGAIAQLYLDAVHGDDADEIPAQFILSSCTEDIPQEIRRQTFKVEVGLPSAEELDDIITQVIPTPVDDKQLVVRAGQGLSEVEFVNALVRSQVEHAKIDHVFINSVKIETIRAGGLLEIRTPSMDLSDIGGLDRMKELIQLTAWTWAHPDEARALKIEPLRRFLLMGISGSGKSAICEASARELRLDLAKTGAAATMSKWVGESEANMRRVFQQIRAMAPIALWIDEFGRDMSGSGSSNSSDSGTTDRVHGEFLTGLQELPSNVFLMCAANRIDSMPPEMTRADRFDKIVFVGLPTLNERSEIFKIHLGDDHANYDVEALASETLRFTGAEIKALVKEARFKAAALERRAPTMDDFVAGARTMKGRVWVNHRDAVMEMYKRAQHEWDWASSDQEAEADAVLGSPAPHAHVHSPAARVGPIVPSLSTGSRSGEL